MAAELNAGRSRTLHAEHSFQLKALMRSSVVETAL